MKDGKGRKGKEGSWGGGGGGGGGGGEEREEEEGGGGGKGHLLYITAHKQSKYHSVKVGMATHGAGTCCSVCSLASTVEERSASRSSFLCRMACPIFAATSRSFSRCVKRLGGVSVWRRDEVECVGGGGKWSVWGGRWSVGLTVFSPVFKRGA